MKKATFWVFVLFICFAAAWGEEVKIQDNTPFAYACLEGNGSYNQISAKIGQLMEEITKQQVLSDGNPFGLYLNSPQDVKSAAELKWLVGISIPKEAKPAAPLKRGEFSYPKVARYLYTGPYERVGEVFAKIMQFIGANGYRVAGPIMEMYWNDPMTVKPEQLMTEILIPVEKK